ncbi:hypothetical protein FNV43_RR07184 [Rhamnella rubrinervis]|uniref:Uncharacterized protein n=1 Tax=Rhamnella rubrinervis TaxID=2594499 RepID=A0A8K0HG12_9ROSA|nr:hypothetical protein FNV43_RR07184 [Rhamnella rubrinervis]
MNPPFSSKITTKPPPATTLAPVPVPSTAKIDRRRKKKKKEEEEQSHRNPLQNLNGIVTTTCTSSEASSVSIEAPRGCLRFFLSHAASSSLKTPVDRRRAHSKNPKSNPITRPSEPSKSKENNKGLLLENSISRKARLSKNSPSCLCQWQSGKKPSSKTAQKSKTYSVLNSNGNKLESGYEVKSLVRIVGDASELTELKSCGDDENFTPLNKISTGLRLDCTAEKAVEEKSNKSNSKTPPVQASVSPEIQCGSSMVSTTTPACYGAGHVVSGITDKRKCRPRGILAVGENDSGFGKGKALGSFDDDDLDDDAKGLVTSSDASMVPLPTEASMHWLLSPCKEDDEDYKEDSENSSCRFESLSGSVIPHSIFSPSSGHRFSSDVCDSTSITNCVRRRSTSGLHDFQEFLEPVHANVPVSSFCKDVMLEERLRYRYDLDGGNSPFSVDSLVSGNVVRTPQSDSSTDRHADLSWLSTEKNKTYQFYSELNSVTEVLHVPSLSHNGHASVKDQIDLSFPLDCLTTSCSSVDLTQFQPVLRDHGSWNSSSTLGNESQSQMRISWREGLISQIYEMDEFDCCRCLSDEEEDIFPSSNEQLKYCQNSNVKDNDQILTNESWSAKVLDNDVGICGKGKESFPPGRPHLSCPCAESISTDGGSLLASGDSDWTQCYKNDLFEV